VISWVLGSGVSQRAGRLEKTKELAGREQGRGVRGKAQAQISPREGLKLFAEGKTKTLLLVEKSSLLELFLFRG